MAVIASKSAARQGRLGQSEPQAILPVTCSQVLEVRCARKGVVMNVLVVDVGGTNVKIFATGQDEPRRFPSGPTLTAGQMVAEVKELAGSGRMTWSRLLPGAGSPGSAGSRAANLAPGGSDSTIRRLRLSCQARQ